MGASAVRLLLSQLNEPGTRPRSVRLAAQFVHRESCGCREEGPAITGGGAAAVPGRVR